MRRDNKRGYLPPRPLHVDMVLLERPGVLHCTGERPLSHRTRPDSRTIPGVILAEIWMRLRSRLRDRAG